MLTRTALLTVLCAGIVSTVFVATSFAADTGATQFQPFDQQEDRTIVIPYHASLTDADGQPAADGVYDLQFALYDSSSGGALLWAEQHDDVASVGGAVTVDLGAIQPLSAAVLGQEGGWLAVAVRGPGEGEFTLLEPRQELLPADAASARANTTTCIHNHAGETWSASSGNGLRVNSVSGYGLMGISTNGGGVYGASTNNYSGVFDNGVRVIASDWHGVQVNAANWAGVWVQNAGYAGVEANGTKGAGVLGVSKDVDSVGKAGLHGYASGGFYYGVLGQDGSGNSDAGYGLRTRGYPNFADANGDARISDDLYVDGVCSGCALTFTARNDTSAVLTPGDVIAIAGIGPADPARTGQRPLLLVKPLSAAADAAPMLGVVIEGAPAKVDMAAADNGTTVDHIPAGGYMFVAAPGQLVQMNVSALTGAVQIGDALVAGGPGGVLKAGDTLGGVVLGRALEAVTGGESRIWVMLTFR